MSTTLHGGGLSTPSASEVRVLPTTPEDGPRSASLSPTAAHITALRAASQRRTRLILSLIALAAFAAFSMTLMVGATFYSPADVIRVLAGQNVPGANFPILDLRLPRATMGLFAGFAFGVAGITFQTMLRNPLASPDVIGIASGASASAVFAIIVLGLSGLWVSGFALVGALATAFAIFALSNHSGFAGTRMILIGIGLAAMLNSVIQWILSGAASWDLQTAMRWLSGSLNGAHWGVIFPLIVACVVFGALVAALSHSLDILRLGDDTAQGLGVQVSLARVGLITAAVCLLAFATAASGPIAFVAFMAGPIATRLVTSGRPPLLASGLVGALLVLSADLVGQNLMSSRYPVGVITGLLGAPFLIYLLIRMNRSGGRP